MLWAFYGKNFCTMHNHHSCHHYSHYTTHTHIKFYRLLLWLWRFLCRVIKRKILILFEMIDLKKMSETNRWEASIFSGNVLVCENTFIVYLEKNWKKICTFYFLNKQEKRQYRNQLSVYMYLPTSSQVNFNWTFVSEHII